MSQNINELRATLARIESLLRHPPQIPLKNEVGTTALLQELPPGYRSRSKLNTLLRSGIIRNGARKLGNRWVFDPRVVRAEIEVAQAKSLGIG